MGSDSALSFVSPHNSNERGLCRLKGSYMRVFLWVWCWDAPSWIGIIAIELVISFEERAFRIYSIAAPKYLKQVNTLQQRSFCGVAARWARD